MCALMCGAMKKIRIPKPPDLTKTRNLQIEMKCGGRVEVHRLKAWTGSPGKMYGATSS